MEAVTPADLDAREEQQGGGFDYEMAAEIRRCWAEVERLIEENRELRAHVEFQAGAALRYAELAAKQEAEIERARIDAVLRGEE